MKVEAHKAESDFYRKINQPSLNVLPTRNQGLIAGLLRGNRWLISPDHTRWAPSSYNLGCNSYKYGCSPSYPTCRAGYFRGAGTVR